MYNSNFTVIWLDFVFEKLVLRFGTQFAISTIGENALNENDLILSEMAS